MTAVITVVQQRLARHWVSLVAAGLVLGIGFGLCFASLAAARRTDSAYERILAAADAPDAAVALSGPLRDPARALDGVDVIEDQRVYAGFVGSADGVDAVATSGLLASVQDRFPIELPTMVDGRLPEPDALGEAFITSRGAERGRLAVGDRLDFRIVNPLTGATVDEVVTIVGIGTLPIDAVTDETSVAGTVVLSRAFYDAHRDLAVYAVSNVDLAPGVDARGDLAPAIGELGHQLQSARTQEQQSVDQALRPLIIVLVALGVLLFAVTALAVAQVIQRLREGWVADDRRLRALGMTAGQIIAVELATSALVALAAMVSAIVVMVVASPIGPVGPLHDLDPDQGATLDLVVAGAGTLVILLTLLLLTLGYSSLRQEPGRPRYKRPSWLVGSVGSPAALAGLTLALRPGDRRGRVWRGIAATGAATAVVAVCLTFVSSAIALTETPARYGFDADLLALNAYGDQSIMDLERVFGERDDVVAATGFISDSYLVDGLAVPGLAATTVRGEVTPTLLRGRSGLTDDEIVLGEDTLESVDAELGDLVAVQLLAPSGTEGESASPPVDLRVVGVATFPPVNQTGTDMPRLGIGALVARDAFLQMGGSTANQPEFTMVRMADGADPAAVIADLPEGFVDAARITTTWFTDTKPAELVQLDAAMPYLRAARLAGFGILLAVVVHACWVRARADRRDLAVLRAVGFTRRQLDAVSAWQVAPLVVGALLLGVPLGVIVGRRLYMLFAQSLAVVDLATISATMVAALVGAVLVAVAIGALVALAVARRSDTATVLREA